MKVEHIDASFAGFDRTGFERHQELRDRAPHKPQREIAEAIVGRIGELHDDQVYGFSFWIETEAESVRYSIDRRSAEKLYEVLQGQLGGMTSAEIIRDYSNRQARLAGS